jgi:16S rRNA (cytosine1402-N4)-methyltransferase
MIDTPSPHLPVLYQEVMHYLHPASPGIFIDATVGAGGHASGILYLSSPDGRLLGLDVDVRALEIAHERLAVFGTRVFLLHASYTSLQEQIHQMGWNEVQGVVIDLGVSSMQIDNPERGFSFMSPGPLDMRFDTSAGVSAADLINQLPEDQLADLIWKYGEETQSRRIARVICQKRPLQTTLELSDAILRAAGGKRGRIHPATRTFQALRIAVNQELKALEDVLPQAVAALAPQGRLAVISFHSLEDRIVKHYFQHESRDCICPPKQPVCTCQHKASIKVITRQAVLPAESETRLNPRARSAKLRVAEKLSLA